MCCTRQTGIILKDFDVQTATSTTSVTKLVDGVILPAGVVHPSGGLRITVDGQFINGNASRTCQFWMKLNGGAPASNVITVPVGNPFFSAVCTYIPDDSYKHTFKRFLTFVGDQLPSGSDQTVGVDVTTNAPARVDVDFSNEVEIEFEVQNSDTTLETIVASYTVELL